MPLLPVLASILLFLYILGPASMYHILKDFHHILLTIVFMKLKV